MQLKDVYIICSEGEAEDNLFGYLKTKYNSKKKSFKAKPLGGFSTITVFKRKYNRVYKEIGLRGSKPNERVHFVFLIDNDLDDSDKIVEFIRTEGHEVQLCERNTETALLGLAGVTLTVDTPLPDFRKKFKTKFIEKFGKEAHKMKDADFDELFDESIFATNFAVLHKIFNS